MRPDEEADVTDRNDDRMTLRVLPRRAAAAVSERLLAEAMSHPEDLLRLHVVSRPPSTPMTTRSRP